MVEAGDAALEFGGAQGGQAEVRHPLLRLLLNLDDVLPHSSVTALQSTQTRNQSSSHSINRPFDRSTFQ